MWKARDHGHMARGSIAEGNRHGGPHEHKREIARRKRQAMARDRAVRNDGVNI
jgi:hypothetical protein